RELVRIKINDGNAFWNEIGVNAGVSKLMLLSINVLLPVLVYAVRHSLTAVRHKLMLSGITFYCWFWATAKVKTVNGERQIQVLGDKKKVIITETSIRSDLKLEDDGGTDCLHTTTIFAELERMGAKTTACNEFSSTMASAIIWIYVTPSHTKKIFANMKREGKRFSDKVTPLFQIMMIQAPEDIGKDSTAPTDSYSTPIITQPSSSKPQKKQSIRKQRKDSGPT
ncbi:hypothetical protein Tco_1248415, partial [Tanacetum coccineum]